MSLIVKISADTNAFSRAVNNVSKDVQGMGKKISKVGDTFKPMTIGATGLFAAAIKAGSEFQAKMSEVSAVGQVYGKDLEKLTEKARELGKKTKFSATQAAEGLLYMGQAGWSAQESLDGIEAVMDLAAAGSVEVGRASDILTDALTSLGMTAKETAKAADVMATVAAASNTDIEQLGETFKYGSQIAGTLGINIDDLSLAIGLMANASVKGSRAGTALRGGLVNLVKPTDQMKETMDKYGVSLVKNKDGTVNLRKTMEVLRRAMKGLDTDQKAAALSAIFGKTALSGWAAIVNASDKDFNDLSKAIANSEGAAKKMAATVSTNVQGDIERATSSVRDALISVFEAIAPTVSKVADTINVLAQKFTKLPEGTQQFIIMGVAIGGLIAPTLKLVGAITKVGSKIAAIPVAMQKIKRGEVERQTNAWLRWNNVTDTQAAKMRRVARDIDIVRRNGVGLENAAKRLDKEFQGIDVPPALQNDLKKVRAIIETLPKKVNDTSASFKRFSGEVKGVRLAQGLDGDLKKVGGSLEALIPKTTRTTQEFKRFSGELKKVKIPPTLKDDLHKVGATVDSLPNKVTRTTQSFKRFSGELKNVKIPPTLKNDLHKVGATVDTLPAKANRTAQSFKRFGGELKNVKVPPSLKSDLNKVGKTIDTLPGKVNRTAQSLKKLNLSDSVNIKVGAKNVHVDNKGIKNKAKGSGAGKNIAKAIVEDTSTTLGSTLGGAVGTAVGSSMGAVGPIIGDIIGTSIGTHLSSGLAGGLGKLGGVLAKLPKLFNPVTLGITAVAGGLGYLHHKAKTASQEFELMGKVMGKNGEVLRRLTDISEDANSRMTQLLNTLMTIDEKGQVKELKFDVKINYKEELKNRVEEVEKIMKEHLDKRIKMIENDTTLSKEQKEKFIANEKEKWDTVLANLKHSLGEQSKAQKDWNEKTGQEKWKAGQEMLKQDLQILMQQEMMAATSGEEVLNIQRKYDKLFLQGKGKLLQQNHEQLLSGIKDEQKMIQDAYKFEREEAYKSYEANKKILKDKLKNKQITQEEFNKLMENEKLTYEANTREASKNAEKKMNASREYINMLMDEAKAAKDMGLISQKEYSDIIKKLLELSKTEATPTIKMGKEGFEEGKKEVDGSMAEIDKKEAKPKVGMTIEEFNQKNATVGGKMEGLGATKVNPTIGANTKPFDTKYNSTTANLNSMHHTQVDPKVGMRHNEFDDGKKKVKEDLNRINNTKVDPKVGANKKEFEEKNKSVHNDLNKTGNTQVKPKVGMNSSNFQSGYNDVQKKVKKTDSSTATVKTRMDNTGFWGAWQRLKDRITNNPIIQTVKTVFTGGGGGKSDNKATGGQIGRGTTIVGERGPEVVTRRGNQVDIQPLRTIDRAMGGYTNKDLVGGGGDTYNITIVGHNKSAKELFDEIEQYKNTVGRYNGTRRF